MTPPKSSRLMTWNLSQFFERKRVITEESPDVLKPNHREGDNFPPENILILLNQPLCSMSKLESLWDNCKSILIKIHGLKNEGSYRICADGGANRLFDLFDVSDQNKKTKLRCFLLPSVKSENNILDTCRT